MKKRIAIIMIVALTITTLLGACRKKDESTEGKKNASKQTSGEDTSADRDTLIVGFDAEYPPYGYMDEQGEYVGFDLECAQLVCDALGWTLEKKPLNWDSKDMELESGTIDCIWNGFSITPDRKDAYTWSSPYVDNTQVMVVPADAGIKNLDDLAGKNVVVQAASAALEALNGEDCAKLKESFASLTENPDYNTAFMNMESGAADAVAIDIGVANYQLEQREKGKYIILEEPFYTEQYGIGFRVGDQALRDKIEEELIKLVDSGKYEELAVKYGIDPEMLCLGK
ncbi:amino acid ABC transporter substrate-binding protein [Lachnospiraceae bacterium LCP25S3_G4]